MIDRNISCDTCQPIMSEQIWTPIFEDNCNANLDIEMDHNTDLNFGSSVTPVIGTANDYALSENKPSINGVVLVGNKTNEDINIGAMSNMDIESILNSFA